MRLLDCPIAVTGNRVQFGLKVTLETLVTALLWVLKIPLPVATSHILIVPSELAEAIRLPSELNATL